MNTVVVTACAAVVLATVMLGGCARDDATGARDAAADGKSGAGDNGPSVTVSGDDRIARSLSWETPEVELDPDALAAERERAQAALAANHLYEDAEAAIPLYLAILEVAPDDAEATTGLQQAMHALIVDGDDVLARAGDEIEALRSAHRIAAVARSVQAVHESLEDDVVPSYLARVDAADRLWDLNRSAELQMRDGHFGEDGGGALASLREALRLQPGQPRAMQGLAAVESGLIRRAESAAGEGDFDAAQGWLAHAAKVRPDSARPDSVRPDSAPDTIADARTRIQALRDARISQLRDAGLAALQQRGGIADAHRNLAQMLLIAEPGNAAAAELRQRIDLTTHYGIFRPGQNFTDALSRGGRGPEMVVVPHGAFRMGAPEGQDDANESEQPAHYIRFDRGFAMSRNEVTVDEFRRFVNASDYKPRASRRGHSMTYEERSGNFVRRSGVDWQSDYAGKPAADNAPVLHVSARDAEAYAAWLSEQSGGNYRLPSEAEFEYALRAGGSGRYPWGDGAPPARVGNLTGSRDRSPGGRGWRNAFDGYGDGFWGPAPVGHFKPNAYGLHDMAGNVSEWVVDCWHDSYRRAPEDGEAWINPGCRTRVIRGGAWASAPEQTRSAWRAAAGADTTNPRIGFRVVREL